MTKPKEMINSGGTFSSDNKPHIKFYYGFKTQMCNGWEFWFGKNVFGSFTFLVMTPFFRLERF